MRLISLKANKESFHPVFFNKSGPSIILASKKEPAVKDDSRTYNGVGKSLIVALIHFCLGSNKIAGLEENLTDWEFTLEFEHQEKKYSVTRAAANQNRIILNGMEMILKDFKRNLEVLAFKIPEGISTLSFRSLISSFIRRNRESYTSFDKAEPSGTDYQKTLRIAFLLGLDVDLVVRKHDLKVEKKEIDDTRNKFEKDRLFREYFTGNKDPEIELADLDRQIKKLEDRLKGFQVAEDYHERQKEANAVTRDMQDLRNRIALVMNAMKNIDQSLSVQADMEPASLFAVYDEAQKILPESVKRSITEVTDFHQNLLESRLKRLTDERTLLIREQKNLEEQLSCLNARLNSLMSFLGTHGALDEFVALSNLLSDLRGRARKIRDYKGLLDNYKKRIQQIVLEMSNGSIRTTDYLEEARTLTESNLNAFRSFSERFYGDRPGGLTVKNNDGDNQIRFDINVHIQDDASDGINEVKIFCYDLTILTQKHNHMVNFLFHDSRLYSNMDPRQRATAFKLATEISKERGLQYIATVNEDQINSMRDLFSDEEYAECFEDSVVLKLTDENPEAKLLGIEVDMDYE